MRDRIFTTLLAALVAFFSFGATAFATEAPLLDLLKPALEAVKAGQGILAACLLLVFAVAVARRYGAKRFPFLASDAGGALLTLLGSFGGALGTALMAGTAPSLGLATTALGVAFAASGGYSMIKRLVVPTLRALQAKLPAWARPVLDLALWIFGPAPAIAKAEAAGAKAVEANPATGAAGIVGTPKSWP